MINLLDRVDRATEAEAARARVPFFQAYFMDVVVVLLLLLLLLLLLFWRGGRGRREQ